MRPSAFLLPLLLAVGGVAPIAHAAPPPAFVVVDQKASDRADDLVKRALALGNKDRYAEAEPLLREAWSLKRSYDIAANLGIVEAALGKWRDAAELLTFALKAFPVNGKAEHKKLVEITLAKALQQVTAVVIKATLEKVEITVDGKLVGTAPLEGPIFVEAGTHAIEARLAGYEAGAEKIQAVKGGAVEVALVLRREVPPPPVVPAKRSPIPGAVLGGVAGVALATGVAFLIKGAVDRGDARELNAAILGARHSCVTGAANFGAQCVELNDTALRAGTFHNAGVGLVVTAAAATAGSLLYFLWPTPAPKPGRAARLVPEVSATSAGLHLSGSF